MTTNGTVLLASGVIRRFQQGKEQLDILCGVDLTVDAGETVAIVGVSGSGKTTLLNLLGGLDDPDNGSISVCGKDWQKLGISERAAWRNRNVGFVYQFHHLLGEFTALENVALPCLIGKAGVVDARSRATQLLEQVGLASRLHHKPSALSGGERQRVAIARALATNPAVVLMDEPTGNLDPHTAEKVLELLIALNSTSQTSFLVVTHDRSIAARMNRTVELVDGKLRGLESAVV